VKTQRSNAAILEMIRTIIREELDRASKKNLSKPYEDNLLDDPSYGEKSVYVPDDIKAAIKKWAKGMKLDGQ
jgi:hypothetical protein